MIEKIKLPKEYEFLTDKYFLLDFFKKNDFFSGNEVEIKEIKENSIVMDKALKIFINYKILVNPVRNLARACAPEGPMGRAISNGGNAQEKEVYAIRRFGGTKIAEFKILKYFLENFPQNNFLLQKPFFYFKKEKFLFYEGVAGRSLNFFSAGEKMLLLENKIDDLIDTLIFLQKSSPPAEKYNFKKDKDKARKFEKEFLRFLPSLKKVIKKDISLIFQKKKDYFNKIPHCFCHNDFTLGNIIWEENLNRWGVIDFSQSCYNDPLTDVGSFLSQLDYLNFLTGKSETIKNLQDRFIKTYLSKSESKISIAKDYFQERLSLFRAWGNLQNAIFILGAENEKQDINSCSWFLNLTNKLLTLSNGLRPKS